MSDDRLIKFTIDRWCSELGEVAGLTGPEIQSLQERLSMFKDELLQATSQLGVTDQERRLLFLIRVLNNPSLGSESARLEQLISSTKLDPDMFKVSSGQSRRQRAADLLFKYPLLGSYLLLAMGYEEGELRPVQPEKGSRSHEHGESVALMGDVIAPSGEDLPSLFE